MYPNTNNTYFDYLIKNVASWSPLLADCSQAHYASLLLGADTLC